MENRPSIIILYPALYIFFVLVNDLSYWLAISTAFPELLQADTFAYYYKLQFPVSLLSALFDSLSFFITLYFVKKALSSTTPGNVIGHLSADLIIAILAIIWIVFVFSISEWIVGFPDTVQLSFSKRYFKNYELLLAAVNDPVNNLRNIYFGTVIAISAMIPTAIHFFMGLKSLLFAKVLKKI